MKLSEPINNAGICLSDPLRLTDVVQPSGCIIALGPEFRLGQVAQQVPVARPIAAADPTAFRHECEELR